MTWRMQRKVTRMRRWKMTWKKRSDVKICIPF
jgi:hypothetical protein